MRNSLTLSQANSLISEVISMSMPDEYWIRAEVSEMREVRGHCYLGLVEKTEDGNTPIAEASAKCWQSNWSIIKSKFELTTHEPLRRGMSVLLQVYAQFHQKYGFSWIITDIDPSFTLGGMAKKRMEIVSYLKSAGIYELQKELTLPLFAQRIAVISSDNAAGYGDFISQLRGNEYGLHFDVELFSAVMQGEKIESSIISVLDKIIDRENDFDVVVIIRGGGAVSDMSGFDSLPLAECVVNFPLPIITGIGHDRDECVLDLISFHRVKTPTAVATFLIDHLLAVYMQIMSSQDRIVSYITNRMRMENLRLERISSNITSLFSLVKNRQEAEIDRLMSCFTMAIERYIIQSEHRLALLSQRTTALDPQLMLKRGYSMTLCKGKILRDSKQLNVGDEIDTILEKGRIHSKILSVEA